MLSETHRMNAPWLHWWELALLHCNKRPETMNLQGGKVILAYSFASSSPGSGRPMVLGLLVGRVDGIAKGHVVEQTTHLVARQKREEGASVPESPSRALVSDLRTSLQAPALQAHLLHRGHGLGTTPVTHGLWGTLIQTLTPLHEESEAVGLTA